MYRKLIGTTLGLLAVTLFTATAFVPVSLALPDSTTVQQKRSGLTAHSIDIAQNSAMLSNLVAMAPQTSVNLLSRATRIGPHAPNSHIQLTITLKLAHPVALQQFLQQVQNPASPVYHQWLTPQQATAQFGPSRSQVQAVMKWLKSRGIHVLNVTPNRMLIHTEATTAAYSHALNIQISDYRLNGRVFFSTTDRPKIPRAIAGFVQNVVGLDRGVRMQPRHIPIRPVPGAQPRGVSTLAAPPPGTATYYFRPGQIATAYNVPDINDPSNGQGVTIAILTAKSPNLPNVSAPHDFWAGFGLPDHTVQVETVPQGASVVPGGMNETLLDLEWSGVWAPGAKFLVYVAADTSFSTFLDMYSEFQTDNAAAVMTTSWGAPAQGGAIEQSQENIFALAATQGISMFAAAGDAGSGDGTGTSNACDYPAASLYITAAGGTELHANISGNRISEVAAADAGGAVCDLPRPIWQVGPGVPPNGHRNTSDMSLNYGNLTPYLFLSQGKGWGAIGGTSAVAPQLAGMFAVAVSRGGYRIGQSNALIFNDVNAGNYSTDFYDVTTGNNGAYSAGPGWDHPTGWGVPNATSLISHLGVQGPKGTLTGTVTASADREPVAEARIVATSGDGTRYSTMTLDDGSYSIVLPAGTLTVKVSIFGYKSSSASVTITDGQVTTHDVALQPAPKATLSGKVSDGSGHGYGLYALIKVRTPGFGQVALTWTNPADGSYSIDLPRGKTYTMSVAAAFDGYDAGSATVTMSGDKSEDFALTVAQACAATGYVFKYTAGFGQNFNGATFPPTGWSVANDIAGSPVIWKFNSDWYSFGVADANWTGGTGTAADVNSGSAGSAGYQGPHDSSLVSPPIPVASLAGSILKYKANFREYLTADTLDLDISTDGGLTWTNVLRWRSSHGEFSSLPGENVQVDLAPYLPTSGTFQLRWRDYSIAPGLFHWDYYAQIDDVAIGACQAIPGGLVIGQVRDANTGKGIVGALVTADSGESARTIINPTDPDLPSGFYEFFLPKGQHTLTVAARYYSPGTTSFTLQNNASVRKDVSLKASKFGVNPHSINLHVTVNNAATASIALSNMGTGTGTFKVLPFDAPLKVDAAATGPFALAPRYPADSNLSSLMAPAASPQPTVTPKASTNPNAAGDVVAYFWAGMSIYGLGVDRGAHDLWLGSPYSGPLKGDKRNHRFLFDGTDTGDVISLAELPVALMADMAYDANTGTIWQISLDNGSVAQSHIYEFDPATMQLTGKSIPIPSPQSERGLAYNPVNNTWYAGDFLSNTIYHFDASGTLLDSMNVAVPITGLAFNPGSGHLFVLTSAGAHAIVVLDVDDNYARVGAYNIEGYNSSNSGAGLGASCSGNLVISDFTDKVVYIVKSGETGWCGGIPWLTMAPSQGTVNSDASKKVILTFDGSGQKRFTTTHAFLSIANNSPYGRLTVPLSVTWVPQPVDLALSVTDSPNPLHKGGNLTYTVTVSNQQANNHGSATGTKLNYGLPTGVSFVAVHGDASCVAAAGMVSCEFGEIAPGASKTVTIAVKAANAGSLNSTFKVQANEPDTNTANNTVTETTTVIGTADLSVLAANATIPLSGTGTIHLQLANAGPDTATDVQLKLSMSQAALIQSASISQGSCVSSGQNGLSCDIGELTVGAHVRVDLTAFGAYRGSFALSAQVLTSSNDPDQSNNVPANAPTVTVSPSSGSGSPSGDEGSGGGGALGWLALAALLGLGLAGGWARRRG